MATLRLDSPIQYARGVGPRRAELLRKDGVETVQDALYRLPFRYENRCQFTKISDIGPQSEVTIRAEIVSVRRIPTRRPRFSLVEGIVHDGSGALRAIWFNQDYLERVFQEGKEIIMHGPIARSRLGKPAFELRSPHFELIDGKDESIHTGRIVPIYHSIGPITSRQLRSISHHLLAALEQPLPEFLPGGIREQYGLPPREVALHNVHFPQPDSDLSLLNEAQSSAHHRLAFEEFFLFFLALNLWSQESARKDGGIAFRVNDRIRSVALQALPFRLTPAQKRVLQEIASDMQADSPMCRLIQGDVGCGKTIVALLSAIICIENGYQTAFMAPTEILAEQHALAFRHILRQTAYRVGTLTASITGSTRTEILADIEKGKDQLVVGTHALLEEGVRFGRLGLTIIDEQHRFGVRQRARLRAKGNVPDLLVMTATPIPRSLTLTLYGDLDVSIIDELPPGRQEVATRVVEEDDREEAYAFLRTTLEGGGQGFVVCPVIEESEDGDLQSVERLYERLKKEVFPHLSLGLLHGRLSSDEKEETMERFRSGACQLLVTTTVIEVGIDVPAATVILIEQAERFGLAQIHQLRGRVGRGTEPSHCLLLRSRAVTPQADARLKAISTTNDGFEIAEADLLIRGPGDVLGTRQSGLPTFRVGDLVRHRSTLEEAREAARSYLEERGHTGDRLLTAVRRRWEGKLHFLEAG